MGDLALAPGDVIDTPVGPVAITGCSQWPASNVPVLATVSAVDDDGETRFFRRRAGDWIEVMARG